MPQPNLEQQTMCSKAAAGKSVSTKIKAPSSSSTSQVLYKKSDTLWVALATAECLDAELTR